MWLNQLKIAVVQRDLTLLNTLLDDIPTLEDPKDIESAQVLLNEAATVFTKLKDETAISMKKMKKSIEFLRSTHSQKKTNKLDIKS